MAPRIRQWLRPSPPSLAIEITTDKLTFFRHFDKDHLHEQYVVLGKSMNQIARERGGAQSTVWAAMRTDGSSYGQTAVALNSSEVKSKNKCRKWSRPTVYKILQRFDEQKANNSSSMGVLSVDRNNAW